MFKYEDYEKSAEYIKEKIKGKIIGLVPIKE